MNTSTSSDSQETAPSSTAVRQIAELCRRHPIARKTVLVPYTQLGKSLTDAVARQIGGVTGLTCLTPRRYALQLARRSTDFEEKTLLTEPGRHLLIHSVMQDFDHHLDEPDVGLDPRRVVSEIADAFQSVHLADLTSADIDHWIDSDDTLLSFLAQICGVCEAEKFHGDFYDETEIFVAATRAVTSSTAPTDSVIALFGETEVHEVSLQLIEALQKSAGEFYMLGAGVSPAAPETTAAGALHQRDTPSIEDISASTDAKTQRTRFFRATGPMREVRSVLRDILTQGHALDEVEIAYTASRPYLSLIADEAERLGVPYSLATGLPLPATRQGQAIRGFFEWIESGYDAPVLVRLLRSGLLQTSRWMNDQEELDFIPRHQIASTLASYRYGPGPQSYLSTLDAAIDNVDQDSPDSFESKRLSATRALMERLVNLASTPSTTGEMAAASLAFFNEFAPNPYGDEADAMVTEQEDGSAETVAATVLRQQLLEPLVASPFDAAGRPAETARTLREMLAESYLGAQEATGGALHVLPLDSAGFTGRNHLYVVGMDSETASASPTHDPVLREERRTDIREDWGVALPGNGGVDESAWRFGQALRRHRGTTTLVATTFDPNEGESRHPSTLYLSRQKAAQNEETRAETDAPVGRELANGSGDDSQGENGKDGDSRPTVYSETLVPSPDSVLLSDNEAWLLAARSSEPEDESAARASAAMSEDGEEKGDSSRDARDAIAELYPWTRAGEAARLARSREEYTTYDGILQGETPELNFLDPGYDGPPISAGRLQMLATAPYAYFLKYVLGVEPREEPALDDESWLNPKRKGSILHEAFQAFMEAKSGTSLQPSDREDLFDAVYTVAEEEAKRVHPGTDATFAAALRELQACADLFFTSERQRAGDVEPLLHEWGFGYSPEYRQEGDVGDTRLSLGNIQPEGRSLDGISIPVRGRIDRVDRLSDGTLAIWDYKTGSQSSFSRNEPLKQGEKIQWALYALVLEQARDEEVSTSGYFFVSEKEAGARLGFPIDDSVRAETVATIADLADLARTGSFPIAPNAHRNPPWRYGDWDFLHRDLKERLEPLDDETKYADDLGESSRPHFLDD